MASVWCASGNVGRLGNSSLEGCARRCNSVMVVQRLLTGWATGSVTGLSGVARRQNTGGGAQELAVEEAKEVRETLGQAEHRGEICGPVSSW